MSRSLETYQLELKVKGPVFVGSGQEIQKKEYFFLGRDSIAVIAPEKLYQLAKQRNMESEFEKFMLQDSKEDLRHWAQRNQISREELEGCAKYVLEAGDRQVERGRLQIMSCITDPYGCPYIPGSSIKGMLRTVLLCADLIRNPQKYQTDLQAMQKSIQRSDVRRDKVLKWEIGEVEGRFFRTLGRDEKHENAAVNDWMSGIIIGDSEPLSRKDIILCQKWEKHLDGSDRTLNLLRECVKPGTVIRTTLTIDKELARLSAEDIREAVKLFYARYFSAFQSKFPGQVRAAENTVFLGGGSGFVSKTALYALFGEREAVRLAQDVFERTNAPRQHKHKQDASLGVSPHILKCTRYGGREYRMGECELLIH